MLQAKLIYTEALMREARADEIVSTVSHLLGTGKASKIKEDIIKGEECRRWCPVCIFLPNSFQSDHCLMSIHFT